MPSSYRLELPGTGDSLLPDKGRIRAGGAEVGAVWLPAAQSGSPMTYMVDGKQYIVVAVSGGSYSGEYIAFKLPG
jgi:glucose dehydrogenase